ncbi:PREDICTED: uncharacterized protein LOC105969303 [Erythranthe guttata]|uniref:uncharacterized protein LOC105969303 n=1 Tax=Erythranthe guttata TaxID=4155 RepID=UPI00064DDF1C|nr:PREDICTED: uncharacterized protein LOC105969303 [Erythranthe guttata]XP_012849504.1 PREDICTED: uncharacterized protein LOC105969303 [Erythranthe guttata]XP_012849505.1 PREDICTED: uncharacterized protein LOC105969303 [Erythranthe guttata]XP_012849506.1 PREDICTED: uncharacterized protein LOC105969303 [Erythranthe guttata]XP_012849507.1 PREDICTED: uncharacterized protein LOC105969303 [Erythranthe guttata]XP_012849508.1 PREDICTED: uncharacterized protein LOC105969303 [Erythranthe guttata]XP_01|eukprot:XP_012849503.1 PREDICTED: uncharacterized protein LOC105969303 [Erythranthe guttata]
MDKSWMHKPRSTKVYKNGLNQFLDMAFANVSLNGKIICPCKYCKNAKWASREIAKEHLLVDGFIKGYTHWVIHGEDTSSSQTRFDNFDQSDMFDDMDDLVHDAFGIKGPDESTREEPNEQAKTFYKLLGDAQQELYPGCKKFSKLAFILRLFHLKCMGKWSNKTFTLLLELLKEAFPDVTESLPKSYYEMQKIIGALGLSCIKIDSCPNDCMLYWKKHENDTFCHICNTPRYKQSQNDVPDEEASSVKPKKIATKVLRYFPLTPRLQRIFMSSKTASLMRWHKEECTKDGCMRHPSDSPVWHAFDRQHKEFAKDSRNVRLGLASDGFSPFKTLSVTHSTWPVIVTPYNIPPWMCMKEPFFFLTLLIPGPSSPGNNIDVYLQPLVEELKELWNGVETYDASSKKNFNMRVSLLWTINDFPAYANLSGWSTKGELACPMCHKDTWSKYLYRSRKQCYMGHRRFLSSNHPYRKDANSFDGKEEHGTPPLPLTGDKILEDLGELNVKFGKKVNDNPTLPYNWKKRSIFFNLPYWKDIILRHNLDVMHIEKNVCDNVLGTLLNLEGKTKDHENSRLDLKDMGIRHALHPTILESGRKYLPAASFSMSKKEKEVFF